MDDAPWRLVIHRHRRIDRSRDINGHRRINPCRNRRRVTIDRAVMPVRVAGNEDRAGRGPDRAADECAVASTNLMADGRAQSAADDGAQYRVAGVGGAGGE